MIRLYVDAPLKTGDAVALNADQAHYLRNVMRRGEGDGVLVFNGVDGEFAAVLEAVAKKNAIARIGDKARDAVPIADIELLFAPIKRGAVDFLVQKVSELGVAALMPVKTERTNAARINIERLQAIGVEAAEQCGRFAPPRVAPLAPLNKVLSNWPQERVLIFCDEAGDDPNAPWGGETGRAMPMLSALQELSPGQACSILIGPEGGFSPNERAFLREQSFTLPVTLGPRILRADTAAIAAVTLWQAALGDLKTV